ncbi:MAG: hypothetical protein PHC38_04170 [Weeksellaceae bacterium]|jgi:hypothetical protein|nr:hypothetical protein [Weeksellaceae bacterium]
MLSGGVIEEKQLGKTGNEIMGTLDIKNKIILSLSSTLAMVYFILLFLEIYFSM